MTRAVTFWNVIAKMYAKQTIADTTSYQRKLKMTQAVMRPDMNVLEFGSGSGSTAVVHAPHVAQITGIDYAHKMVAIAREKAADIPNARFETATLEEWDAPDASYDMILGLNTVHLLADHKAGFQTVRRLLKPDGIFVSSTMCLGDYNALLRGLFSTIAATRLIPKPAIFTAQQHEADITDAGFKITENWQPKAGAAHFIIAQAV